MNEYVRSILLLGTLTALLEAALPLHKERLLPYAKFVIGLAAVLVLTKPVAKVLRAPSDFFGAVRSFFTADETVDDEAATEAVLRETASGIAGGITDFLVEKYEIPADAIRVTVSLDAADTAAIRIVGVAVEVEKNALPPLVTAAYLSARLTELVGAPVSVS